MGETMDELAWDGDPDPARWAGDLDAFAAWCQSTGELEALERALWPIVVFELRSAPGPVCRVHNLGPGPALGARVWLGAGTRAPAAGRPPTAVLGTLRAATYADVPLAEAGERPSRRDRAITVRAEYTDLFGRRHDTAATLRAGTGAAPAWGVRARRRRWREVLWRS